jgi:ADP-ribose pyrophosphatase YjhB (NUDIX family)
MTTTILCYDQNGRSAAIPQDEIIFFPAAYGILIENNQVLLQRHPVTDLWRLPGGILAGQETPGQAVRRHFRAVTGMSPLLGPLLHVEEQYLLEREGQGLHLSVLYYALERPAALVAGLINFDHPQRPEWIALDTVDRSQLQFGYEAIQAARLRLNL